VSLKIEKNIKPERKDTYSTFCRMVGKRVELENFISLTEKIKIDYDVSLIIQNGQIDRDLLEEIEKSNIDIIQTSSVLELIDLIKSCSFFIGNRLRSCKHS